MSFPTKPGGLTLEQRINVIAHRYGLGRDEITVEQAERLINDMPMPDAERKTLLAFLARYGEIDSLTTVQLHTGRDRQVIHLVRTVRLRGTPGPLLCGFDHHRSELGFSVGGGVSGPGVVFEPCADCVKAAVESFRGLPISGLGADAIEAAIPGHFDLWRNRRANT